MSVALSVFWSILQSFVLMGLGVVALKWGMLRRDALSGLTKMDLDILMPALTFVTITGNFDRSQPDRLWQMPALAFGISLVGYIAGFAFKYGLKNRSPERLGTFHHLATVNNYLFLPLIIIDNLWGSKHTTLLLLSSVGNVIALWTLGIMAFQPGALNRETLKKIFGVNFWAVIVAVGFVFTNWQMPVVVFKTLRMAADMTVPLMFVLCGAAVWLERDKMCTELRDASYVVLMRLVVIPAITLAILAWLPMDEAVRQVTMVIAVMPSAVISVLITGCNGGNDAFAGQAIITTTVAAILTVPLWLWVVL